MKKKGTDVPDAVLIKQYMLGDNLAFEGLVHKHKTKIFSTIYLIVKDRYVAEDLLQETFIKVIDVIKGGRYNEEGKFLPWVLRIAHNMAIDTFRKAKRYPTIVLEDGTPLFDTLVFAEKGLEEKQAAKDTMAQIRALIIQLPETQREVLMLRHFADLSFQEIAQQTGVSINTALGRMRYALINLRKKLSKSNITYDVNQS